MKSRDGNSIITVLAPATAVKMEVNGQPEILVPVNGQNEFQRLYKMVKIQQVKIAKRCTCEN